MDRPAACAAAGASGSVGAGYGGVPAVPVRKTPRVFTRCCRMAARVLVPMPGLADPQPATSNSRRTTGCPLVLPRPHRSFSSFRRVVNRTPRHPDPAGRKREPASFTDLPGPEATVGIIQRHEALRRRGRPAFSVVVVDVGAPPAGAQLVTQLIGPFLERARSGDEMGWLAADRLALILPLTGREGALRFVAELFSRLGDGYSTAPFDIFTA